MDKSEAEIGLYYFGARWYDASLGRFISEDPLKGSMISPQSQNPYVYCMNNPLRYIDPTGLIHEVYKDENGNIVHSFNNGQMLLDNSGKLIYCAWGSLENVPEGAWDVLFHEGAQYAWDYASDNDTIVTRWYTAHGEVHLDDAGLVLFEFNEGGMR
ncbi:MAG: RHS repeat-associated core domain-containing protein, partial [Candidatus Methanofastidiosa archaeon]|nr:RHS repeat-associated core domain-containing protein [Candidatus Methanofastidiosa archaeon]